MSPDRRNRSLKVEIGDVSPGRVVIALAVLAAGVTACIAAAFFIVFLVHPQRDRPPFPLAAADIAGAPALEQHEGESRAAVEAQGEQRLEGFSWIDRAKGKVRIPIAAAMRKLAERGWPADGEPGGEKR